MTKEKNIAVVGTGLAGLTAALAISQMHDVILIGEAPGTKQDGRTTAVMAPGVDYLQSLNLWSSCAAHAVPLTTLELIDGDNTPFIYDASETNLNEFGFNVPNALLRDALLKAIAKNKNITWIKQNIVKAERNGKTWSLQPKTGKKIDAVLVIAADGRNSFMRQAAGIETDERDENQTALVTIVQATQPHHYTSAEWYRPGGPLTFVPMDGKKLAVVWCEDDATTKQNLKRSVPDLSRELTTLTQERFGKLTLQTAPQAWPIKPMKAQRMTQNNVVLIGEAAHVMPPIGAQGFNASLQDIIALMHSLTQATHLGLSIDDPSLLGRYERVRLRDTALRYHSMTRLNDLIRTTNPLLSLVRGAGLRSMRHSALLKKRIMHFGLGYDFAFQKDRAA